MQSQFYFEAPHQEDEDLGIGVSPPSGSMPEATDHDGDHPHIVRTFMRKFSIGSSDTGPRSRSNTLGALHMLPKEEDDEPTRKATNVLFVGHESAMGRAKIEDLLEKGDQIGSIDQGFIDTSGSTGYGFGWIEGVYVRCTLSIFGVIMFLRLNWMFAQAGIGGAIGIIIFSVTVTSITTMSLSAISTNGKVAAGGIYFMVSRCLGADVGVIVGLALFIAQSLAVALNVVGVAEAVVILEDGDYIVDADWDAKIYAIIGLIVCFSIAFMGANFEVQVFIVFTSKLLLFHIYHG